MNTRALRLALAAGLATALFAGAAAGAHAQEVPFVPVDPVVCGPTDLVTNNAVECGGVADVPSIDPEVQPDDAPLAGARAAGPAADAAPEGERVVPSKCHIHNEAVFYAAGDWFRLGQKLVQEVSPCSDFFISIPPLAADKVNFRSAQGLEMDKLGPQVQALAEIHFTSWQNWWRANGKTPYEAGVEARRRYELFSYDGWALNEIPSSDRQGVPGTRAVVAQFLDGLYDGPSGEPSRGVVFIVGVGQHTSPLSVYKTNLRNWLGDHLFWGSMQRTVRFWAQEVYGNAYNWGIASPTADLRVEYTTDYLQHEILLARAGGELARPALDFLERTHVPLANAAWRWPSAFGNTMVDASQMAMYVAEQTYAMRAFVRSYEYGLRNGRIGFAWAMRNMAEGGVPAMPAAEFVAQTGTILDRLGDGLRHAYAVRGAPNDACGPGGKRIWCEGDVAGAWFYDAWKDFTVWSP
jgi:hypothetical protein